MMLPECFCVLYFCLRFHLHLLIYGFLNDANAVFAKRWAVDGRPDDVARKASLGSGRGHSDASLSADWLVKNIGQSWKRI